MPPSLDLAVDLMTRERGLVPYRRGPGIDPSTLSGKKRLRPAPFPARLTGRRGADTTGPRSMKKIHLTLLTGAGLLIAGFLAWAPSWWSRGSDRSLVPRVVSTAAGFPLWIELASGPRLELSEPPTRVLPGNAATVDFVSALIAPERDRTRISRYARRRGA